MNTGHTPKLVQSDIVKLGVMYRWS